MHKVLRIEPDHDPICPMEHDGSWKLIAFDSNSIHHEKPDNYVRASHSGTRDSLVVYPATPGLQSKARAGLFYLLDYFEHGEGAYSIHGEGAQCRWDTSRYAGVLLWDNKPSDMGAKTPEARAQDARNFLEEYNAWMNGHVYGYVLEDREGEHIDSCWGFYDGETIMASIADLEPGDIVKIEGQCSFVVDASNMPEGVECVDEFDEEIEEALAFEWACRC